MAQIAEFFGITIEATQEHGALIVIGKSHYDLSKENVVAYLLDRNGEHHHPFYGQFKKYTSEKKGFFKKAETTLASIFPDLPAGNYEVEFIGLDHGVGHPSSRCPK